MTAIQTFGSEAILALRERWSPIPKRAGYALGMAALLTAVVILPLAYLGSMAAIGWGIYWYITATAPPGLRGLGGIFWTVLWFAPPAAGGVLVLFLLKPLLAPRASQDEPYIVTPAEEPRLFAFVYAVCQVIGAPEPGQIAVDSNINASAGFRRGWISLLRKDDMVLTIGMPLVAGMSKREFAGVLAHEFGHFAQGSGMRLTYAASTIVNWFARAAWERDAWDEGLARVSREAPGVFVFALFARLCVFVARCIFKLVAFACFGLCAFVLRQMEFDADRYEIRLSGTEAFVSVTHRLTELHAAFARAEDRAAMMYRRNSTVPDNFPALVADAAARITPEAKAELERRIASSETGLRGLLATHPSTAARRAHALEVNEPGLFTDDGPASELFSDFSGACLKASFGHYKSRLGGYFRDVTFVPTAPLLSAGDKVQGRRLERYAGFEPPAWRPIFLELKAIGDVHAPRAVAERLKQARARVQKAGPQAAAQVETYRSAIDEMMRWQSAKLLLEHGLKVDFKSMGLKSMPRSVISQRIDDLREKATMAAMAIDEGIEAAGQRLRSALSMLGASGIERIVPDAAAKRARADELLGALKALEGTMRHAKEIRNLMACVEGMSYSVKNKATFELAKTALRPVSDQMRDRLEEARIATGAVRYPFPTDSPTETLGTRLVGASPGWREFDQIIEAGQRMADAWPEECRRALVELVEIAEGVEKGLAAASKSKAKRDVQGSP